MQKSVIAVAMLTAIGLAVPLASSAQAEVTKKIIIKHGDRGHHYGWRNHHRDYGWRNHHRAKKVVIIKHGHRHYD